MGGKEQIVATIGPLSTSLEGIKLFLKTVIGAKPWLREPSLLPFEWREEQDWGLADRKLKVAVMWDDGVVRPQPPVTRALKEVVEKLREKGNVEVVDWTPYKHDLAWEIVVSHAHPSIHEPIFIPYRRILRKLQKRLQTDTDSRQKCTSPMAQPKHLPP